MDDLTKELNTQTLYTVMKEAALRQNTQTALVFYGRRYSFKKVLGYVDSLAAGLKKMGIIKGSVVTLCMLNTPSAQLAFYAINRLGAIVNLVHPKIPVRELNISLQKTESCLLIAYDLFLSSAGHSIDKNIPVLMSKSNYFMGLPGKIYFKLYNRKKKRAKFPFLEDLLKLSPLKEECAVFKEEEPAVYLPSGGTTDTPKIIMHCNKVFINLCSHAQYFLSEDIKNYTAMYSVLPIFHGFGLCMNMHMCAQIGIKNVLSIKFKPQEAARVIKKEKINIIMGVPSMFNKLLDCKRFLDADLSSLKDCFIGGDSAPKGMIERFNKVLKRQGSTGALYQGYGLAETAAACVVCNSSFSKAGSAGKPLPDTKIKIYNGDNEAASGEIGEICINSPLMMLGYLDSKESPVKKIAGENWLFTGDLGFIDEQGFLFFKQRIKNMIKVSGVPVFPCEIEEAAQRVEGVVRAAAIGVPDTQRGESIKLFIEAKTHDKEGLKEKILKECSESLIPYAVPKIIELCDSLPLNDIGKIDKKNLK